MRRPALRCRRAGLAGGDEACLSSAGYAEVVDLGAVKGAAAPVLAECAIGAAANAQGLLDDAELLSAAGRYARAYALAALAVEEAGKAAALFTLALMPRQLRARAPLGRLLEWHQLKLVGGMLIAAVPFGPRTIAARLLAMPQARVAEILDDAQALAQDLDYLKQRGLYADIDRSGQVQLPAQVVDADVPAQLDRARRAVSSASGLLDPDVQARLVHPSEELLEFGCALVSAFAEAGDSRTPEAAAHVLLDAVSKLHEQATSASRS
jgi:AbiV family abortive infection protein